MPWCLHCAGPKVDIKSFWVYNTYIATNDKVNKMTTEQREKLQEILEQTWRRDHSADEAFDLIEDLIYEVRADAKREVE